jgi:hypothetical protein
VNVLPATDQDFYTFIGLATTDDALWTVAVVEDPQGVASRLLRIDLATGAATEVEIPGVIGPLSPPTTDGRTVWTASEGGLHRVAEDGVVASVPLDFQPAELTFGQDGLWIARAGGTTLVDPLTGATLRVIDGAEEGATDRLVGAPTDGSLWQCEDPGVLRRIDRVSGRTLATFELPAGEAPRCRSPIRSVSGVAGIDGVIPTGANVVVDPATGSVELRLGISGSWTDFFVHDGSLWFIKASTSSQNEIALLNVDPATGSVEQHDVDGTLHLNTTFESGYAAIAGDWLWILADGSAGGTSAGIPTMIRIPLAELERL